ncbi:hypothetical protein A6V37_37840 [Paraburkholderia ginsengiterrae]|uniref:Uncharacterized protein n=1 Tax=Paraburkholderia ginsengiterrae TaxID=1462993 RepID=A0A1A9NEQ2_9BURK|nr:hypothetical protein A6V37_37840 [Paraburkholderia ginsengiterrae]
MGVQVRSVGAGRRPAGCAGVGGGYGAGVCSAGRSTTQGCVGMGGAGSGWTRVSVGDVVEVEGR